MWLEAILTKDDLHGVVAQFAPMRFRLGDNGELCLDTPSEVSLIRDQGIRVVCSATLHWPVLGFDVPISIRSVAVLVRPEVEPRGDGAALVFKPEIAYADVALVPSVLDEGVARLVNEELAKKHVELAWNFERTLSHVFPLPAALETTAAFGLHVKAGTVRVTDDALGFAVSFSTQVQRRVDGIDGAPISAANPSERREGSPSDTPRPQASQAWLAPSARRTRSLLALPGAVAALALGAAFALGRGSAPRRRWLAR